MEELERSDDFWSRVKSVFHHIKPSVAKVYAFKTKQTKWLLLSKERHGWYVPKYYTQQISKTFLDSYESYGASFWDLKQSSHHAGQLPSLDEEWPVGHHRCGEERVGVLQIGRETWPKAPILMCCNPLVLMIFRIPFWNSSWNTSHLACFNLTNMKKFPGHLVISQKNHPVFFSKLVSHYPLPWTLLGSLNVGSSDLWPLEICHTCDKCTHDIFRSISLLHLQIHVIPNLLHL